MKVSDNFTKFQIYRLSVSTVCKEKDSYFKEMKSGTPVRASVILNRRHITSETEKLFFVKLNYQTQGSYMSLSQAITSAKFRNPHQSAQE
jgi:hypothetical protein